LKTLITYSPVVGSGVNAPDACAGDVSPPPTGWVMFILTALSMSLTLFMVFSFDSSATVLPVPGTTVFPVSSLIVVVVGEDVVEVLVAVVEVVVIVVDVVVPVVVDVVVVVSAAGGGDASIHLLAKLDVPDTPL